MNHINELSQPINLNHPANWVERIKLAATLIKPYSIVVEYGAGEQLLKQFLPKGCSYKGFDIVYDNIDMNTDWPLLKILPDVEVALGLLEWLDDVPDFIRGLKARQVIVSYAIIQHNSSDELYNRIKAGWKNDFTFYEIINFFRDNDYGYSDSRFWNDQVIFNFKRIDG